MRQVGYEALTVQAAAVGLTVPNAAKKALIENTPLATTTHDVRWRADGTNPTSTTGAFLESGARLDLTTLGFGPTARDILDHIKFIRDTGSSADATLLVSYFDD